MGTSYHFALIGIEPELGRIYTENETDAVVLSHSLWKRRFGSDGLVFIGLVGSYVPARRALRVDPKVALKAE